MVFVRGTTRPLLLVAVLAAIASTHAAEGLFNGGLKGAFNGVFQKVENLMDKVVNDTMKKFSVLSGVFGEGVTRGDLSLPEIINGAFSRNNGIFVGNSTTTDMDWKLGDGTNVVAAISNGGSIGVTTGNGQVTITTGQKPSGDKPKDKPKDKPEDKNEGDCAEGKGGKDCGNNEDAGKDKGEDGEAKGGDEKNSTVSFGGADMDEAFTELLSNWDEFVTSPIWDVQEQEGGQQLPVPTAEAKDDMSMESAERVVNGIFFGNSVAAGASFGVKFFYNNEENFYCSGSLIGYPYVLTAAHCGIVVGDNVRVGGRLLRSGYKASVGEVILHPNLEPGSLVHDVAIVRLNDLVDKETLLDNGVKAARINKKKKFPRTEFVGVLSGHGSVELDGKGVSDELRSTRQAIFKTSKCQKEITQGDLNDEESYLCAGDGERSTTCVGDSGAGLWHYVVKETPSGKTRKFYEVFGVVSFGEVTDEALCPRGPPTVFQRTSENYDWIVGVVGKQNMP